MNIEPALLQMQNCPKILNF